MVVRFKMFGGYHCISLRVRCFCLPAIVLHYMKCSDTAGFNCERFLLLSLMKDTLLMTNHSYKFGRPSKLYQYQNMRKFPSLHIDLITRYSNELDNKTINLKHLQKVYLFF